MGSARRRYHVVIGAIESVDMFVFEAGNVFVPEASLDVPMLENYVGSVAMNAATGPAFGQPGSDGSIRAYPLDWQPMINCPGPYAYDGRPGRRPGISEAERADVTYSLSWISAVTAAMPAQLYFRRAYGGNATGALIRRAGQFARQAQQFAPYIAAQPPVAGPGGAYPPAAGWQRGGATSAPEATSRAGLWVKPGSGPDFCGLLAVVSLQQRNESTPPVSQRVTVTLSAATLRSWPAAATATAECIDGGAQSGEFEGGVFHGLVIRGENTAVFRLHSGAQSLCRGGPSDGGNTPVASALLRERP